MSTSYTAQINNMTGKHTIQFETDDYDTLRRVEEACQREIDRLNNEEEQPKMTIQEAIEIITNAIQTENMTVENQMNELLENYVEQNSIQNNAINTNNTISNTNYVGEWYINEEKYFNAEKIDEIMEMREENRISQEEFESQMQAQSNTNVVELDVESYFQNKIKFDFKLTSPAPTQKEGKLDNIIVEISNGVGTFTYTDNWGTSGNGTITLSENKIQLKLETTKAAQGALWGVEGIYTFSYRRVD